MAKAKKLPSGSWRCLVFSHWEETTEKDGKVKKKRVYKSFVSNTPGPKGKREAEQIAAEYAAEKEALCSRPNLTLGEYMDRYIESRSEVLSPSTVKEYKRCRKNDLPELTCKQIMNITQEDIQKAINKHALNHSPKTVRNTHGFLSVVMYTYRPNFPIRTDLPKKVRPNLYVPSDDDILKLMNFTRGTEMEVPILLAAFGPMRRGEICALDSDHISGNIVHVEFSIALNENNEWVKKRPKSYAGDRYIEFPDYVIQKIKDIEGPITMLNPAQVSNRFARLLQQAGMQHFRFHDLRHYSASIQHALGIPDAYIMQRGGWGNDDVLKNVYRHVMEQESKIMNAKANSHFNELCNTTCNTKTKKP